MSLLPSSPTRASNTLENERQSARCQAGFTIIEMLVALTIAAIVISAIAGSISLIGRGWDWSVAKVLNQDMIARALDVVSRDLNGLQRVVNVRNDRLSYVFSGTRSQMRFVTVAPPYPTRSGLYCIRLEVRSTPSTRSLIRTRAPYKDGCKGSVWRDEVELIRGPYSFRLSYGQDQDGRIAWHSRFKTGNELPGLIRLAIVRDGTGASVIPDYIVRPRIDGERDCVALEAPLCAVRTGGLLPDRLSEAVRKAEQPIPPNGENAQGTAENPQAPTIEPPGSLAQPSTGGAGPK
ncbi:MAG: prepilin-type N-terminal cleavage/methylation domain-containing protein [Alphaproteobacteria bacterium]|nr:prepilin-type N-terminal cleavage/methylation domain-containing protein [Alphaproteobacteria bacterium]